MTSLNMCSIALAFCFAQTSLGQSSNSFSADTPDSSKPQAEGPSDAKPLINAKSIGFSKDGSQQIFDGDVIAIGPKSLVTADKIIMDEKNKLITAEGHVIVLSNGQYVTGEKIELSTETGDAKVISALLVVNDSIEAEKIAKDILGYSISEIEFEVHRKKRVEEVEAKKKDVRLEARTKTKSGQELPPEMIKDYAKYLEQEDLITRQENPAFAQMSEERRQTLRRRRDFWDQSRIADSLKQSTENKAYFRLTGQTLERINGNDLIAKDGVWTPCHCAADENPAWAIRSSQIFAQPGGYATFNNAVLEIKGVPVLYLPWLRLPIKGDRQTGFLPPSISSDSQSGSVYSQPLFLNLGKDKDITIKSDIFERRGTKLGFEGRYQRRKYSGFQLNLEVMRDRVWLAKKEHRQDLFDIYEDGLAAARADVSGSNEQDISAYNDRDFVERRARQRSFWNESEYKACLSDNPSEREKCEASLFGRLRPPANSTRGSVRWRGQERITDRLSFASNGEFYSDRQYNSDLYTPESFQASFDTGSGEKSIVPSKFQFHYDQQDYYLGLGSSLGDYVRTNDNFEGFQLPAIIKSRSKWYRLGHTGVPVYASVSLDQYRFSRVLGNKIDPEESTDYLGAAWWRRATGSLVAPLSSKTAVQVDHFTDVENRSVAFDDQKKHGKTSQIQSLRTGFRFQLPIDGKTPLPGWLGGSSIPGEDGTRYLQHVMNWTVTLSARPNVVRSGKYGDPDSDRSLDTPRYFMATDGSANYGDDNISAEEYMNPYQLVSFSTTHRWKVFSEIWKKTTPKTEDANSKKPETEFISWDEKARRELLYSIDRAPISTGNLNSNDQSLWFNNRYQLLESDYYEPVSFGANISYDYLKEKRRKTEGSLVSNRPWSEAEGTLSINAFSSTLTDTSKYNLYDKLATKHALSFNPPGVLKSNASFGYTLENTIVETNGEKSVAVTNEKSVTVVTSLTEPVFTTWSWGKKESSSSKERPYRQKIGFVYSSSSRCWGLGFSREKAYEQNENAASYALQLNIIFMGQPRDLPDMSPGVMREVKKI